MMKAISIVPARSEAQLAKKPTDMITATLMAISIMNAGSRRKGPATSY